MQYEGQFRDYMVGWLAHQAEQSPATRETGGTETSLATIPEVEYERWWIKALVAVDEPEKALAIARNIRNNKLRATALKELALDFQKSEDILNEAMEAARKIDSDRTQVKVLAELADYQPDPGQVLSEALNIALKIDNGWMKARVLMELVPHFRELPGGEAQAHNLVEEALAATRRIKDSKSRTDALNNLKDWLIESGYPREALATVRAIEDADDQKKSLTTLAFRLMELGYPKEALAAVGATDWDTTDEIEGGWRQATIHAGLGPRLSESPTKEPDAIPRVIDAIKETDDQTKMLTELAFRLMDLEHPKEALIAAQAIAAEKERRVTITKLASLLPESLREEALSEILEEIRKIEEGRDRAKAMIELVPYLSSRLRDKVIEEARLAANTIVDDWPRAEALAELSTILAEMDFPMQGLRIAWTISTDDDRSALTRAKALADLVPHVSKTRQEKILAEILTAIRSLEIGEFSRQILRQIAPHLPESLKISAWEVAQKIKLEQDRIEALVGLVPFLPESLKSEALNEALMAGRDITASETSQASALSSLVVHLNRKSLLREALAMALAIENDIDRAKVLQALSPQLAALPQSDLAEIWIKSLPINATNDSRKKDETRQKSELPSGHLRGQGANMLHILVMGRTRRHLLSDLRALEPVIAALGKVEGVIETARAIQDVGRWWP